MAVSQLKKLRAAAREKNLIGHNKSRKRQSNPFKNKQEEQKNIQAIRDAFNPFNTKINRQKRQVLGLKNETGRPGLKKQMEETSRKIAFEAELSQHNRVGGMVDRRFGESNPTMSYEEKMQERFTREHQMRSSRASSKRSMFNLEDENEDMDNLFGPRMRMRDDFDEGDLGIEDNQAEQAAEESSEPGFRDFRDEQEETDPGRKKTKSEIMKEVIAKSKLHKFERQQAKLEDQKAIEELDEDDKFHELLGDLVQFEDAKNEKSEKVEDEYEKSLRELAFDRRAQPSDRTLTQEEEEKAAKEEAERLLQERELRMTGEMDQMGPDDIDFEDDFNESNEDEAQKFGFKVNDEEQEEEKLEDSEESPEELQSHENEKAHKETKVSLSSFIPEKSVCPSSLDQIKSVLSGSDLKTQVDQIKTIIKNFAPDKAEGNKDKLGEFTCALVDYVCWLGITSKPQADATSFDEMINQLKKLIKSHTLRVSEFIREKLADIDISASLEHTETPEIFLFILIGIVYSTSDHYHLVATPATLIICSKLSRYSMESPQGICFGVILAQIALKYQRHSKRYMPEVTSFLLRALATLVPKFSKHISGAYAPPKSYGKWSFSKKDYKLVNPETKLSIRGFNGKRYELLGALIGTISSASTLWKDLNAHREILDPFLQILETCQGLSNQLDETRAKLIKLAGFSIASRKPLAIQSHRPLPIQTVAPQFDENYNLDKKSYNLAPEQAEHLKLRAELKKEKKGLLRDIRKDAKFLAREKLKRKLEHDEAYHDKLARLERSIQTEEGAEKNKYEREKKNRKK